MPEIPELEIPPGAVNNARQAVRWLHERKHWATDPSCRPEQLCETCAMLVAEAVALALVEGGGYVIGSNGAIIPPMRWPTEVITTFALKSEGKRVPLRPLPPDPYL